MSQQHHVLVVFECPECFALLPYLGCNHSCSVTGNCDEGFSETDHYMAKFVHLVQRLPSQLIHLVPAVMDTDSQ